MDKFEEIIFCAVVSLVWCMLMVVYHTGKQHLTIPRFTSMMKVFRSQKRQAPAGEKDAKTSR